MLCRLQRGVARSRVLHLRFSDGAKKNDLLQTLQEVYMIPAKLSGDASLFHNDDSDAKTVPNNLAPKGDPKPSKHIQNTGRSEPKPAKELPESPVQSTAPTLKSDGKSFKEILNPPDQMTGEARLLANMDPFGEVSNVFNPWAIRVFREFKKNPLPNSGLRTMCCRTEEVLLELNSRLSNITTRFIYGARMNGKHEDARRSAGRNSTMLIPTFNVDREYLTLAALLTIQLPRKDTGWIEYDKAMAAALTEKKCSIDSGLLAVHAINTAKQQFYLRTPHKAQEALIQCIVDMKRELVEKNIKKNVFEFSSTASNIELFTPIGEPKVRPNRELERLGVVLNALANSKALGNMKGYGPVLSDAKEYGIHVLSSLTNPAKLSTLQVIWESAPRCNLANSQEFYTALYKQVMYSIACEPMQLFNQEERFESLIRSMVLAKFKNSVLIAKLEEIVRAQGMDFSKVGFELFASLVELDAISFAMTILEELLENTGGRFHVILQQGYRGERQKYSSIVLPEKSRDHLYKRLFDQKSFQCGDLAIAIHNFGRPESPKSHLTLLNKIELSLFRDVDQLSLAKATGLLCSYAMAGRYYSPIIEPLNKIVLDNVDTLTLPAIASMIWSAARLNDRTAAYLPLVTERYVNSIFTMSTLNSQSASTLARGLWSLSALQLLDLKTFELAKPLLEKFALSGEGHQFHPFSDMQLSQVWCEVKLLLRQQNIDPQDWCKRHELPFFSEKRSAKNHFADGSFPKKLLPWQRRSGNNFMDEEDLHSSKTHLDASRILNAMGVAHKNEEYLPNGYIADIFIPVHALTKRGEPRGKPVSILPSPPPVKGKKKRKTTKEPIKRSSRRPVVYDLMTWSRLQSGIPTTSESEQSVDADTDADTDTVIRGEVDNDNDADVAADVDSDDDVDVDNDNDADVAADVDSDDDVDVDNDNDADVAADVDSDDDVDVDNDNDADVAADVDSDDDVDVDNDNDADVAADVDSDDDVDADNDIDADVAADVDSDDDVDVDSHDDVEVGTSVDPDAAADEETALTALSPSEQSGDGSAEGSVDNSEERGAEEGGAEEVEIPETPAEYREVPLAGYILEFDGPFHFESYAFKELGPTVMKRRHLQADGYKVVNIPFHKYSMSSTETKKRSTLLTYLSKLSAENK